MIRSGLAVGLGVSGASVGVGFAAQVVGEVPADANDQPVDWILTGEALMRCERRP